MFPMKTVLLCMRPFLLKIADNILHNYVCSFLSSEGGYGRGQQTRHTIFFCRCYCSSVSSSSILRYPQLLLKSGWWISNQSRGARYAGILSLVSLGNLYISYRLAGSWSQVAFFCIWIFLLRIFSISEMCVFWKYDGAFPRSASREGFQLRCKKIIQLITVFIYYLIGRGGYWVIKLFVD